MKRQRRVSESETAVSVHSSSGSFGYRYSRRLFLGQNVTRASPRFVRLPGMRNVCGSSVCPEPRPPPMLLERVQRPLIRENEGKVRWKKAHVAWDRWQKLERLVRFEGSKCFGILIIRRECLVTLGKVSLRRH